MVFDGYMPFEISRREATINKPQSGGDATQIKRKGEMKMAETEILAETIENAIANTESINGNTETDASEGKQDNDVSAELAKAKADYAKLKAALDKATKEAGDARKALRAKQTDEEKAAADQQAKDEATQKELEELRREVANTKTQKAIMAELGADEKTSATIAEYLYGAADKDAALTEIKKLWAAKEKALRLEFGRVPAPGVGAANGASEDEEAIKRAKEIGRERAASGKTIKETLSSYIR